MGNQHLVRPHRQRSTTTPRTVDMRSMSIRRRRRFNVTSESRASRTSLLGHPFMASRKLLKIRPNRVRQNSISDSEEKKEVGAKMEPVDGNDDVDGDEKKQEIERMKV